MLEKNTQRNSSIELLKLISLILIIISHSVPFGGVQYDGYIDLNLASNSMDNIILILFRYFGSLGNCIFIVCSSWFLVDSVRVNKSKIVDIVFDSIVLTFLTFIMFKFIGHYSFEKKELIKMLFPITFGLNWFITCYLLFYMIHPFLNLIIKSLNKKQLLFCSIILIILYSFVPMVKDNLFYTNRLIGFILIYFIVSYLKLYMKSFTENKKINFKLLIVSILLLVGMICCANYLGLKYSFFSNKMLHWNKFVNPLIIIFSISLFNLFHNYSFHNKFINYLSSLSLLIYIIHANRFVDNYLKGTYFQYFTNNCGSNKIILLVLSLAFIFILFSILCSLLYKIILQKKIHKIGEKICIKMKILFEHLLNKILKVN